LSENSTGIRHAPEKEDIPYIYAGRIGFGRTSRNGRLPGKDYFSNRRQNPGWSGLQYPAEDDFFTENGVYVINDKLRIKIGEIVYPSYTVFAL